MKWSLSLWAVLALITSEHWSLRCLLTFPSQMTWKWSSSLPICCCSPVFWWMEENRAASSLTQWIKWMSTALLTACVRSWQLFGRGMLGNTTLLPPDLKQSDGHSHPTKTGEKQGVLISAPSSPCSPNPDASVWIAGGLIAQLRPKRACFIHHLAGFIFHYKAQTRTKNAQICAGRNDQPRVWVSDVILLIQSYIVLVSVLFLFTCAVWVHKLPSLTNKLVHVQGEHPKATSSSSSSSLQGWLFGMLMVDV